MPHPFEKIPPAKRRALCLTLAGVTVLLLTVLILLYGPMKNQAAPQGMVSLELCWTPEHLGEMLASWSEDTRMQVAFGLGLNFLCLFALTNTLALACVWAASGVHGLLAAAGRWVAWGQWVAGGAWAVENSLLTAGVLGHDTNFTLAAASSLAVLKFTLVGAGLLFAVFAGIGAAVLRRASSQAQHEHSSR
jgi:hypothetical protein